MKNTPNDLRGSNREFAADLKKAYKRSSAKKRKNASYNLSPTGGAYVRNYNGFGKAGAGPTIAAGMASGNTSFEPNNFGGEYIAKMKKGRSKNKGTKKRKVSQVAQDGKPDKVMCKACKVAHIPGAHKMTKKKHSDVKQKSTDKKSGSASALKFGSAEWRAKYLHKKQKSATVKRKPLTTKGRKRLPGSAFALPGRRYPIHDAVHARNALARVAQNGSPAEKAKVRAAVSRKFPSIA